MGFRTTIVIGISTTVGKSATVTTSARRAMTLASTTIGFGMFTMRCAQKYEYSKECERNYHCRSAGVNSGLIVDLWNGDDFTVEKHVEFT